VSDDGKQKVQHVLYEGDVEVWVEGDIFAGDEEDPDDAAVTYLILRDGPHDLGTDLGNYLRWLLGPGHAPAKSRLRMAKRLRILVDDLEPDDGPERREVDGNPPNLELADIIKRTAAIHLNTPASALAITRDTYQDHYRRTVQALRYSFMTAAAYELLAARAERENADPQEPRFVATPRPHPYTAGAAGWVVYDRKTDDLIAVEVKGKMVPWFSSEKAEAETQAARLNAGQEAQEEGHEHEPGCWDQSHWKG
jgi:hypothetical protein